MDSRLERAFARIDAANAEDPARVEVDGVPRPAAEAYGQRMSACLALFVPEADDALRVAARAQHLRRFLRPRVDYPVGREGYLRWRVELGRFHADEATQIMAEEGFDQATCDRVRRMLEKRGRKTDADVQRIEDVACLVFLEHYALDFVAKHAREKVVTIVQKTWAKMSEAGQRAALDWDLPPAVRALVEEALAD